MLSLFSLFVEFLWTDGGKGYVKKFSSASDAALAMQKFCVDIPVSVGKLFKVLVTMILNFVQSCMYLVSCLLC